MCQSYGSTKFVYCLYIFTEGVQHLCFIVCSGICSFVVRLGLLLPTRKNLSIESEKDRLQYTQQSSSVTLLHCQAVDGMFSN